MKNLFYLFAIAGLLAFVGCASNSNSGAGKFLGKWQDTGSEAHPNITYIRKGENNTFKVVSPGAPGTKYEDMEPVVYKGLKYNAEKDELVKNKGIIMEVIYDKESKTIQGFVNHRPATNPQKRVEE